MLKALVLPFVAVCTLLLTGAGAFADAASVEPGELSLEAPATEPAMSVPEAVGCPEPSGQLTSEATEGAVFAADKGGSNLVTCTADCGPHPNVSCSGSGSCSAVDRNCPGQRGYVQCGSVVKHCPVCGTGGVCEDGSFRSLQGGCCGDDLTERTLQECVNGQWVTIGTICGPPLCGGGRIP